MLTPLGTIPVNRPQHYDAHSHLSLSPRPSRLASCALSHPGMSLLWLPSQNTIDWGV